ncbi:hypothetical protein [uncultured Thiodictyon sp.]|uniref:hypothetical protein n=1 Tax=uncultured Thiodictyon sp. TaxID=1846217 RepID=UPI0025E35CFA|nr:hypothetical protein [uncultured Thiodictyon sp.]
MKKTLFLIGGLAALIATGPALACGIQGSAARTDGSKVDGTATVSTSWNSTKAYPKNGGYQLDMGSSACGQSADVYVNGNSLGRHSIPSSGYATVNFTLKGSSDSPVR